MTNGHNYANGMPSWVDLTTTDIEASRKFYAGLLGWTYSEGREEFGGYVQAMKDGKVVAGLNPQADNGMSIWTLYFATDDITKACESITENGGTLIAPPMPVGELGQMAIATSESAGTFGLWEGNAFKGADLFNEPGALVWEDLRSTNPDESQSFYNKVFGYRFDAPEMPVPNGYKTFHFSNGERPLGGMGGMMGAEGMPSHWVVYLQCENTPAAEAYVRANGGNVLFETMQTPFGRQCIVTDSTGAQLCLIDGHTSS